MSAVPVIEGLDVARQARALIDLVDADRDRQCGDLLGAANAGAKAAAVEAKQRALSRLREVFAEQRQRDQGRLAAALARLATRRRLRVQRRTAALLQLAWQRLPGELRSLWQRDASRAAWTHHVVAEARQRLQPGPWCIFHAPGWPPDEQRALAQSLPSDLGHPLRFEADESIAAGLRIVAGSNVLDGTTVGLLADRAEIEARLLRRLERADDPQGLPT